MNEKELKIKQQRQTEAHAKNLIGMDGKIGMVVKHLGQPIVAQSEGGMWSTIGVNYNDIDLHPEETGFEEESDELPVIYTEDVEQPSGWEWTDKKKPPNYVSIEEIGWHFNGLSRGLHLEIKYMESELEVHYKGYLVFKERAGDLLAYNPGEWEKHINDLYTIARKIDIKKKKEIKKENLDKAKKNKDTWLAKMRRVWGL